MNAFEFVILFFSFIYTLALTHLLFAWTRMIRHRRELLVSWPHLLWMLAALFNLTDNWISLWDFRNTTTLSLATIATGFAFVTLNYFLCALVSPDFEGGETYDMKCFHAREGPTYILTYLVLACSRKKITAQNNMLSRPTASITAVADAVRIRPVKVCTQT